MKNLKRFTYLILIAITVPLGLATRRYGYVFPQLISEYGGDVLYATMVFFLLRLLTLEWALLKVAFFSYLFCICIETLQLYHAPWIERVRHTFPFGLILGFGFLWSDWVCYLIGVAIGFIIGFAAEILINGSAKKTV